MLLFKVIENGAVRYEMTDFQFVFGFIATITFVIGLASILYLIVLKITDTIILKINKEREIKQNEERK